MNPLDNKPIKGRLAGKGTGNRQRFKPNSNLSGYGKGTDVVVKGNKLALPVTRTGSSSGKLVKRTYTDVAPGLQGGLRETFNVLNNIKSFCEAGYRTDEQAARMIFDKIKGTPNLTIPTIKSYVKRYLDMVGKNPGDIDYLASLVYSHVEDMEA
jgi:hypothetical protein